MGWTLPTRGTTHVNGSGVNPKLVQGDVSPVESIEAIDLLDGGEEAYPRMLLSIERAKSTVHLEVYGFAPSGIGANFIEVLSRAAGRGVIVEVIIDGWGSVRGGRVVAALLQDAGCRVQIFSRLGSILLGHFGRNHRKILLVDDKQAFVGGINIGDENLGVGARLGWADLALEIRGLPCARLGEMIRGQRRAGDESSMQIYLSGLGGGWRLRRRYLKAFAGAHDAIHLAHGYFLPDPRVVRAIAAAARRGVQVRLLLAGRSDVPFARAATRSLYARLIAAGVEIHEWEDSVLHAKVVSVDSNCLLAGSFNLDPFSLANQEVLIAVTEPRVVAKAKEWIQDHFSRARAISSVEPTVWWHRWWLDPLGRIVARIADQASRAVVAKHRRRQVQSTMGRPALAWRLLRKMMIAMVGSAVLAFGVALIVLPGPAFIVIPIGLAILATEFRWAKNLIRWVKTRIHL